jgi:hypothetical protein
MISLLAYICCNLAYSVTEWSICHGPKGIWVQQQYHLEDPAIDSVSDIQLVQVDLVRRGALVQR